MDKSKIDEAVRVMQTLTLEERAVVNYTVDRESKRRIRNRKPKDTLEGAQHDGSKAAGLFEAERSGAGVNREFAGGDSGEAGPTKADPENE